MVRIDMSRIILSLIFFPFWCFGAVSAEPNYQIFVDDIQQRLTLAEAQYQKGDVQSARQRVQLAYFEVFENLEGPIRINISAKRSYQMEAKFSVIRQQMTDKLPVNVVVTTINDLKQDLVSVLPELKDGHQLTAENTHDSYQSDIDGYWQQQLKIIDDLLAQTITVYQQQQYIQASQLVQKAQYNGFKNNDLETQMRLHVSAKAAGDINAQFSSLIGLTQQPDKLNEISYQVTLLLQDLSDQLASVPVPTRTVQPEVTTTTDQGHVTAEKQNQDWATTREQINNAISVAITQYQQGDVQAAMLSVQDAYFDLFEASGMENRVGAADSKFKAQLEGYFTRMVSQMKSGRPVAEIQQQQQGLSQDLQTAVGRLQKDTNTSWNLFISSLLILLREGLEALLIVAAIVAYLVKNGHKDKLSLIRQSVLVALAASLVTAVLFQWLFIGSGASREALEGITMLIAVVVLFGMSYWLLAKVEARRWKAYLEGKLGLSLSRGSLWGLWFTSFLAVYREGAETVLFYYALIAEAHTTAAVGSVFAGMVVSAVALIIIFFLMRYSVVKLPLKPFFLFTGSFMYLMAFVFAGNGVLELIEGKIVEPTLVSYIPQISWLGIYPYAETLTPQLVLLLAALLALWRMKQQSNLPLSSVVKN
jgi:high-affinity iron transporter